MKIIFYTQGNKNPIRKFLNSLEIKDKVKVAGCIKSISELGFDTPRVQFRLIRNNLWEIKIKTSSGEIRIFYVSVKENTIILLHCYKKKSKKAPSKEIKIALTRLNETMETKNG